MEVVQKIADTALSVIIVVGPTLGYFLQYNMIRKTKSLGSFSIDVCAILIFSSIFRVFFWFGKRFESALLLQAVVMIIFQVLLLRECIAVKSLQNKLPATKKQNFLKNFWRWDDFSLYVQAIALVWGVLMVLTYMFYKNPFFVEATGFTSVLIEACLGLPQLISNHKNKSTVGLSMGLIFSWFFGDTTKIYYYLMKSQPMQFVLCGALQLLGDIWILGQIYAFGKKTSVKSV